MVFHISETEITRTYKLHFERPVIATHPTSRDQEVSFTDATITLAAVWDPQAKRWKAKRNSDGSTPVLQLEAPKAKRVRNGRPTKIDAFYNGGKLMVQPIRLDSIQKKSWEDELAEELRVAVVSAFWDEVHGR